VVDDIDETIRQIRTSIFQLRGSLSPQSGAVRARILGVVAEVEPLLGFAPYVDFDGPVDALVSDAVLDDLVAVAREGLTNVARHAQAGSVQVRLSAAPDQLALELVDDGVGIGDTGRRSGLANLRRRAEQRGGSFALTCPAPRPGSVADRGGTSLLWAIPLP